MNQFIERLLGAARLDVRTYEDVEHDRGAMGQAAAVVVLAAVAAGVGTFAQAGLAGLIAGTIAALVGWVLWAGVIYLIGAKLLPEPQTEADMGQVMRALAFAQAPGLVRVFGFIPLLGPLLFFISAVWMLVTMVLAVRQSLDYESTGRAIGVVLCGFIVYVLAFGLLFATFGGPTA